MSVRNGDKARFGRLRKQKILLRKSIREMRAEWKTKLQGQQFPGASMTAQLR
jgi:hypothetical protein